MMSIEVCLECGAEGGGWVWRFHQRGGYNNNVLDGWRQRSHGSFFFSSVWLLSRWGSAAADFF